MWKTEVKSVFGRLKPRRQCDILAVFQKNLIGGGGLWTGRTWLSVLTRAVLYENRNEIWFSKNARNFWSAETLSAFQGFCISEEPVGVVNWLHLPECIDQNRVMWTQDRNLIFKIPKNFLGAEKLSAFQGFCISEESIGEVNWLHLPDCTDQSCVMWTQNRNLILKNLGIF